MTKRFLDKVVLVTGGSSGIGRATALAFAREGAKVIVTADRNLQGGLEVVEEIKRMGADGLFIKCDVSKEADVKRTIEEILERYGRLDCAFNNAGIGPDGVRIPVTLIEECPEDIWDRIIDVNLKGVFLCMKYEMTAMRVQRGGSIVNNASVGALKPIPGFGPYAASKAGVIMLTKTAALEGAPFGIRVNAICPGITTRTQLAENIAGADPAKKDEMLRFVPLRRMAEPEEVANAVLWLSSPEASFITGQILPVDGGLSAT